MRKITLLLMLLAFCYIAIAENPFEGGAGTEESPYQIKTATQLNAVRDYLSSYFILLNDINLTQDYPVWRPIGKPESVVPDNNFTPFTGNFNGQGYVISGLNVIYAGNYTGLFGVIAGTVSNLGVRGSVKPTSGNSAGLLSGYIGQSGITSVVQNCFAEGTVEAAGTAGLIVGNIVRTSTLKSCYSTGIVTSTAAYTGGIAGRMANSPTLENCYSDANVTGTDQVGGVVGIQTGYLNYCYALGNVEGNNQVGGIVGHQAGYGNGLVAANSSVKAAVSASGRVIGFLAATATGWVTDLYALDGIPVSINNVPNSIVSSKTGIDGETKTLADLHNIDFYTGINWNMTQTWKMPTQEAGYPLLKWHGSLFTNVGLTRDSQLENVAMFMQEKLLHIRNIPINSNIAIYNFNGQLIRIEEKSKTSTVVILPQTGFYIIKVETTEGNLIRKIIVN